MKKVLSAFLAIIMVLSLIPLTVFALPAEADASNGGIKFSADESTFGGASEEYYHDGTLSEIPHTISAWVYLDDDAYAAGVRNTVFSNFPNNYNYTGYMHLEIDADNHPYFVWKRADGSAAKFVFSDATISKNTWTMMTIVVDDAADQVCCYLDGALKQSIKCITPIDPTVINFAFKLGGNYYREGSAFNPRYFKGELKDFFVYADARTAEEIASDYANGPALNNVDLICAYDIDANDQGKNLIDLSGNGNHLYYNKVWLTEAEMEVLRGDTSNREYAFAVVPDPQYITESSPEKLNAMYKYIADNVQSKNIQYVMGVGDITDNDTDSEWQVAYNAIRQLDGIVPYTLVRGNHDVLETNKGKGFIDYFGGETFYAKQFTDPDGYEAGYYEGTLVNYRGAEETNTVVNAWRTLEVGGDKWLIMGLDWAPHNDLLKWAAGVIEAHPNHRVIILTHSYIGVSGQHNDFRLAEGVVTAGKLKSGFNNGDGIWDKLVSRYSNIEMVLSGHIPSNTIVVEQNKGVYGNTVTQMLIDSQYHDRDWEGGVGLVALLYVSKDGKSVDIEYYSTVTGKYFGSMNQRTVDLEEKGTEPYTKWDGYSVFAPAGSGTEEDPYRITCAENLAWMSAMCAFKSGTKVNPFAKKYFKQMCDIDLNGQTLEPIGSNYTSSSEYAIFGGIYDGQGYRIYNGYIKDNSNAQQSKAWGVGIFGFAYDPSTSGTCLIKNVVADNITVSGMSQAGIIAGKTVHVQIQNCVVTDTCTLIGTGTKTAAATSESIIANKTPQWNDTTQNRLGGIVGHAGKSAHIYYCVSAATIQTNGNNAIAGGIVGSLADSPNVDYNVFKGKIINDFTDTAYYREIEGENVNGGIIGYIGGTGTYKVTGTRYYRYNVNEGSFAIKGTATTDVVYGGILGAAIDCGNTANHLQRNFHISNEIDLGGIPTSDVSIYVGGLVGRVTNKDGAAITLSLKDCYSIETGIQNGGVNVDTGVYTVEKTYIYNTITESSAGTTKPITTSGTVGIYAKSTILKSEKYTAPIATGEENRAAGKDSDVLKVVGYQKAVDENDYRVRVVYGVQNLDLVHYGYEMTLTYTKDGQTYHKTASLTNSVVYTDIYVYDNNEKTPYNAQENCGVPYFATLVINPLLNGEIIEGEAVCTITAYTVSVDGYRHSYGAEAVTLVFTDGVLTKPEANVN